MPPGRRYLRAARPQIRRPSGHAVRDLAPDVRQSRRHGLQPASAGTVFEAKLRAFSAATGEKLWEADLPASANSVPGTYVWRGKRYVVVCAGGHGKVDGAKLSDAVIAYTLP